MLIMCTLFCTEQLGISLIFKMYRSMKGTQSRSCAKKAETVSGGWFPNEIYCRVEAYVLRRLAPEEAAEDFDFPFKVDEPSIL